MSEFYRVKPENIKSNPNGGIYITKQERNRTILAAAIFVALSYVKRKIRKKFRH